MNINELVTEAGTNSRDHGFHDDWPAPGYPIVTATGEPAADVPEEWVEGHEMDMRRAITEKLALIHEEISEALGEIRSGHDPLKVYYTQKVRDPDFEGVATHVNQINDPDDGTPHLKPEGFMIELADAVIRIADLAFLVGGDLEAAVLEKAEYNRTRPYKHGRKF